MHNARLLIYTFIQGRFKHFEGLVLILKIGSLIKKSNFNN